MQGIRPFSRPSAPAPSLLLAALAAAGLVACGGGGDSSSSGSSSSDLTPAEQQAQDVSQAKALVSLVAQNETAFSTDAKLNSNSTPSVASAVNTFAASMQTDAASLSSAVTDSIHLDQMAFALWQDYKAGVNTSGTSTNSAAFSGCTVYQGAFPGTSLGPAVGTEFVPGSVAATGIANAVWVSCAKNSGPLLTTGAHRYRQIKLYNMSAAGYPASVPYTAVTRAQYRRAGTDYSVNLSDVFSGTVGFKTSVANPGGFVLKGDLPPFADTGDKLLAHHYAADVNADVSTLASGSRRATLASGSFTEWALPAAAGGAATLKLTVNLDDTAAGTTSVTMPPEGTPTAQQLAEAAVSLYAAVSGAGGTMNGSIVANTFAAAADGSLYPKSVKFAGDLSVLPAGAAAQAKVLTGTLDYVNNGTGAAPLRTVVFNGTLTLPQQPAATLKVTMNDVATATPAQPNQHFKVGYARDTASFDAEGDITPSVTTAVFSNPAGVKVAVSSTAATWPITVNGRDAGYVRKSDLMVVYPDGTFNSLAVAQP